MICCITLIGVLATSTLAISTKVIYEKSMEKLNEAASRYARLINTWYEEQEVIINMVADGFKDEIEEITVATNKVKKQIRNTIIGTKDESTIYLSISRSS